MNQGKSKMKSRLSAMRLLEFQSWAAALGIFAAVVLSVNDFALAGEAGVTRGHGYSFFGNLDYPVDYPHLSYVNPDAPKGGELSQAGSGTFDSLIPYSRKGRTLALRLNGTRLVRVSLAQGWSPDIRPYASLTFLIWSLENEIDWFRRIKMS